MYMLLNEKITNLHINIMFPSLHVRDTWKEYTAGSIKVINFAFYGGILRTIWKLESQSVLSTCKQVVYCILIMLYIFHE